MNRSRIRRFLSLTAVAALTLAAIGAVPAAAKNPNWSIQVTKLPPVVAPGNDAAYFVRVKNNDNATVNRVTFSVTPQATPNATPSFFSGLHWEVGGPEVGCTTSGKLVCDLGTLEAGEEFTFTVAYDVPSTIGGKFDVQFFMEAGTGNVGGKNKSRGDKLDVPVSTEVNKSSNFDGGFVVDDFNFGTGGSLGRNNRQNSSVDVTEVGITVNVEDNVTENGCNVAACTNLVGEWTSLTVPGNSKYIKVTLNIWGGSVSGGTQAGDIFLVHVLDNGTVEVIGDSANEICANPNTAPDSGECIKVTKVGPNFVLVAWLTKNGTLRGGF